jgi:hypothetical protein
MNSCKIVRFEFVNIERGPTVKYNQHQKYKKTFGIDTVLGKVSLKSFEEINLRDSSTQVYYFQTLWWSNKYKPNEEFLINVFKDECINKLGFINIDFSVDSQLSRLQSYRNYYKYKVQVPSETYESLLPLEILNSILKDNNLDTFKILYPSTTIITGKNPKVITGLYNDSIKNLIRNYLTP